MKTKICFTGDTILMIPMPKDYTGYIPLAKYVAQGDVRVNNMEMVIAEDDCFASTFCGGTWLKAKPEVLDDIERFSFNCYGFANNHSMDYSYRGLTSILNTLSSRGMVVCGAGLSLKEASAPASIKTKNGSVAVFAISATCDDAARAGDPIHTVPARPGLNMLRHTETFLVNESHMQALQEIAENTYINGRINNSKRGGYTVTKPGVFTFGSLEFKLNDIERKTSTPNPIDMERMKREIFAAREEHDYVVVCFHSHEIRAEKDEEPDYFIEEFSHACIDWGASAVIGTGTHQIKGIEIYKGFPIFYSIANFVFQGEMSPVLPADYYERYGVPKDKSAKDALAVRSNNGTRGLETESKNYRGLIPLLEFEDGKLTSVEVKPIELGFLKDEVNQKGLPFEANEEVSRQVYETLISLSKDYGTEMVLEGGVIRIMLDQISESS